MLELLEQAIEFFQESELLKKKIPLAFMEPYVIQSKLKRVNDKGNINIYWQTGLLLEITKESTEDKDIYTIKDKDGVVLGTVPLDKII